jgi:hypothetical protein
MRLRFRISSEESVAKGEISLSEGFKSVMNLINCIEHVKIRDYKDLTKLFQLRMRLRFRNCTVESMGHVNKNEISLSEEFEWLWS